MKTLTITTARKNLGHWLAAAARGEEIGVVCGEAIIALQRVQIKIDRPTVAPLPQGQLTQDPALGSWKKRKVDGVVYQRKLRAEWGR